MHTQAEAGRFESCLHDVKTAPGRSLVSASEPEVLVEPLGWG